MCNSKITHDSLDRDDGKALGLCNRGVGDERPVKDRQRNAVDLLSFPFLEAL